MPTWLCGWTLLCLAGCSDPPAEQAAAVDEAERPVWASVVDDFIPETTDDAPAASTQRMARLLVAAADSLNPMNTWYVGSARRADIYRLRLEENTDPQAERTLRFRLAEELLKNGQTEEAIAEFDGLAEAEDTSTDDADPLPGDLDFYHALAYLRLAEQDNCICEHSIDSCLLPISGSGIHTKTVGSTRAIELFTKRLEEKPDDLASRWLLNIAYMTLGRHPADVPEDWLVPRAAFDSEYDIARFPDLAPDLGIAVIGLSGGAVMDDFNGDGYLDILASSWGFDNQIRYFQNDGAARLAGFTDRTKDAGLTGIVGGLNLVHADYDNDGDIDVFVLRGAWLGSEGRHPNSLLRNIGDGTFVDATEEAGLLSFHPTQTAAWGDFDNDGWLDLFVGNESDPENRNPCELFRNNRDGTFTECASAVGVANIGFVKGSCWGDYDNDGLLDLYLSRLGQPNVLFHNEGAVRTGDTESGSAAGWRFRNVTARAGVKEPVASFPTWFFDYDNDGWLDLFVAGYGVSSVADVAAHYLDLPHNAEFPRLYRNNRNGTFADVTADAGLDVVTLPMGANFGDLDNDGYLDFYLGTGDPDYASLMPNLMFRNDAGRRFMNVTTSGGFGHLQKGHGVAFGDLDNDGDQDVYSVIGGAFAGDVAFNTLFENPGHGNHWITLRLEGVRSNRAAIGARIRILVEAPDGERAIHATVGSGGSFGASSLQQEIGLGDATGIRSIEIKWPATGETQTFRNIDMDQVVIIREGDSVPESVPLTRLDFSARRGQPAPSTGESRPDAEEQLEQASPDE